MPDTPDENVTAAQSAAAMVLRYAPLLRKAIRLPTYPHPAITWKPTPHCDPAFVAMLRVTWDRLDLRDTAQFSEAEALLFRYHRMHGLRKLYQLGWPPLARHAPNDWHTTQVQYLFFCLSTLLGDKLLALMPPAAREQWFPWHSFDFVPGSTLHTLTLHCDSLGVTTSSTSQPMYYAPRRPTILVQGVRRPVAFTPHAIQRMQERRIATVARHSHSSLHDLFAFVAYNHHFEVTTLYGTQPAVALFDVCMPATFVYRYVEELLGPVSSEQSYLYRFGYCPLVQDGEFWLAKTLLVPGFIGTPEYGVLRQASLDPGVKERLLAACEEQTYSQLIETGDFRLIRWFHTHGIPQVIPEPAGSYGATP
jgi:hypothetical protein